MKIVRLLNSILVFIETTLLCILLFLIGTYIIFNGEEKTGTLVTVLTLTFFVLSLVFSGLLARKIYFYLDNKTIRTNIIFLIALLIIVACTMLFFNLSSYILS